MNQAVRRLKSLFTAQKGDVFILVNQEGRGQPNTGYLTGFTGTFSYVLFPRKGRPVLFTDARYSERARIEAPECRVVELNDKKQIARALQALGKTYCVDGDTLSLSAYERVCMLSGGRKVVSLPGLMQKVRSIKTLEEVALIQKAIKITERALRATIEHLRPGMTEIAVATFFEDSCREHGADGLAFPTIVAAGRNGSQPHAQPSTKKIRKGELVTIDCGAHVQGYHADITRTVSLGAPSAQLRAMYDAVFEAQSVGLASIAPGVPAAQVDEVCRAVIESRGFGRYFTHATGHGVGLEVHELPVLSRQSKDVLSENMVVTCEPGIYIPGVGGARIEDVARVTRRGMIQLSSGIPRTLIVL